MVKETEKRRGRHTFVVNAFDQGLETKFQGDSFEVDGRGVFITVGEDADVVAFISHPCMIERDDSGARSANDEGSAK